MGEPRPRQTTAALRRAGAAAALLLAVGCTADGNRDNRRNDPLMGLGGPSGGQPVAVATANAAGVPPPPAYRPQPPLTPAVPTSNAALAGGGFQPLAGSNDLRIGSGSPAPGGQPQPQGFTDPRVAAPPPQAVPGVTPVPPPPGVATATPTSNPVPVPVPTTATPAVGGRWSLDQAYAAVAAKGPLAYQMKFNSQTGEYTFQLKVPSRLNTAAIQSVDATAATPAEAIQRALEQLGE